jgi:hypothetical protein
MQAHADVVPTPHGSKDYEATGLGERPSDAADWKFVVVSGMAIAYRAGETPVDDGTGIVGASRFDSDGPMLRDAADALRFGELFMPDTLLRRLASIDPPTDSWANLRDIAAMTLAKRERARLHKLTENMIRQVDKLRRDERIRKLRGSGLSYGSLAVQFGVSTSTVKRALKSR